jgi:hypothetical protein
VLRKGRGLTPHFGRRAERFSTFSRTGALYASPETEHYVPESTLHNPIPVTFPARLAGDSPGSHEPFSFEERLYSAREVAARLGVSERWLRDHATRRNPRIRAIRLGPLVRFRWPDVQAFVAEMAAKNNSKHR